MAAVQINLHSETAEPRASVLSLSDGRRFIVLAIADVELILPDFDAEAVTYAQAIVDALQVATAKVRNVEAA